MWQEVRRHHDPLSGVFAWREAEMRVGQPRDGKSVHGLEVSGEFFNVLGVLPWQGRLIEPQDEAGCDLAKVVVSYPYWKAQLGGQPSPRIPPAWSKATRCRCWASPRPLS